MCSAQDGQLPVDLDQLHQERDGLHRRAAVRGAGQLVEVVPDPGQLAHQIGVNARGRPPDA